MPDEEKPKSFDDICLEIMRLHGRKQSGYSRSPLDILPVDAWLYQIQIKATRALCATESAKMRDELMDTAVYCVLLLEKMEKERV